MSLEPRKDRFLAEVRHYKNLDHPAIIKVYDEGFYRTQDRNYPFAVVDYVPDNLAACLGRNGPQLQRIHAVRYMLNVLSGLAYLHSRENPIVHRDIKPANILIGSDGARLGDLGLAKVLMEDVADDGGAIAAYMAGPRFYRTPEMVRLARGETVSITTASDVYQIALVFYQCLTGYNPQKKSDSPTDDIELDLRDISGAGSEVLSDIISQMLENEPSRRPAAPKVLQRVNLAYKEICEADFAATGVSR